MSGRGEANGKAKSRSSRAGLQFPVGRIHRQSSPVTKPKRDRTEAEVLAFHADLPLKEFPGSDIILSIGGVLVYGVKERLVSASSYFKSALENHDLKQPINLTGDDLQAWVFVMKILDPVTTWEAKRRIDVNRHQPVLKLAQKYGFSQLYHRMVHIVERKSAKLFSARSIFGYLVVGMEFQEIGMIEKFWGLAKSAKLEDVQAHVGLLTPYNLCSRLIDHNIKHPKLEIARPEPVRPQNPKEDRIVLKKIGEFSFDPKTKKWSIPPSAFASLVEKHQ